MRIEPRRGGVPADLGAPDLPGCKSYAQRALLLAAFGPGTSRLRGVPDNEDLAVLLRALAANGRPVQRDGDTLVMHGRPIRRGERFDVHAGENGTAARTLLMLVPLLGGELHLDGDDGLRRRPFADAVFALRELGVACDRHTLPLVADGTAADPGNGIWTVDGRFTSQAGSGAMLALALRGRGRLRIVAPQSLGYLAITLFVAHSFGADMMLEERRQDAYCEVRLASGTHRGYDVPRDVSARAFVVALAALHGLPLPPGWPISAFGPHPDLALDDDLKQLARAGGRELELRGVSSHPDCLPALAVVAAARPGLTVFADLPTLRLKESDRLRAMADALQTAGARTEVRGDDLHVQGPLDKMPGVVRVDAAADHRVVMALALLGTVLPGGLELGPAQAVRKSWPTFFAWLGRCADVREP